MKQVKISDTFPKASFTIYNKPVGAECYTTKVTQNQGQTVINGLVLQSTYRGLPRATLQYPQVFYPPIWTQRFLNTQALSFITA
jgi:hypothetical protein